MRVDNAVLLSSGIVGIVFAASVLRSALPRLRVAALGGLAGFVLMTGAVVAWLVMDGGPPHLTLLVPVAVLGLTATMLTLRVAGSRGQ